MLALIKFETPDQKLMDVYGAFDRDIIPDILTALLPDRNFVKETPPTEKIAAIQKGVFLFTEQELHHLVRQAFLCVGMCFYFSFLDAILTKCRKYNVTRTITNE